MDSNRMGFWPFRRNHKEITENEDRTPTLKFFFKLLFRRAGTLVTLNFMMLFLVIPIIVAVFLCIFAPTTPLTTSPLFAPLYGVSVLAESPAVDVALSTVNAQIGRPVLSVTLSVILIAIGAFLAFTWGCQNVGAAYVLRGIFRGDAVFVFSDYFYGIRKNWKQAIGIGLLDFGVLAILLIDYFALYSRTGHYINDVMFYMIFAIAIIFFFMRFYIYQLMITFDMKWTKILKNSLIFTMLGFKRNIMAALGILVLIGLNVALILLLLTITTIPMVLPCFYLFSFTSFMSVYAAYPIIDRYLIKPYEAAHPVAPEEEPEADSAEEI